MNFDYNEEQQLLADSVRRFLQKDYGFETRIVRFHNVYGPMGTYEGGKRLPPRSFAR